MVRVTEMFAVTVEEQLVQSEGELVAMEKRLPVLQHEIGIHVSERNVMQSRIAVQEKRMVRNERLMHDLMLQVRDEERQLQLVRVGHETQKFCADVCAAIGPENETQTVRLVETMARLKGCVNRVMQLRSQNRGSSLH